MTDDEHPDHGIIPWEELRRDPARGKFMVCETLHHEIIKDPAKVGWWDRLTRRRPRPQEIDAMWGIVNEARRAGATIEEVVRILRILAPIPGDPEIAEALVFVLEQPDVSYPAIWIEWPYRWWAKRLVGA